MSQVKISAIGNSAGIVLSKELLARLGVQRGDTLQIIDDGMAGLRIVKADGVYNNAMDAGRACFDRYPETLAELAK
ncbi:MAG: AbrB/MazE/SpoVT family DNA-binding domain-containing protein [Sandarakinorhabdus sp.]|nr:AbrB/MazE/SpoVT family DNA-binding domain-containing protein [Sandarakinorhabdus sp.]